MVTLDEIKTIISKTPQSLSGKHINMFGLNAHAAGRFVSPGKNTYTVYSIWQQGSKTQIVTKKGMILTDVSQIDVVEPEKTYSVPDGFSTIAAKEALKILNEQWKKEWKKSRYKDKSYFDYKYKKWNEFFSPCSLEVKKTDKIYKVLNTDIKDTGFCEDSKNFCFRNNIHYVGQLIKKRPDFMEVNYILIKWELEKIGLNLNTNLVGWQYPLSEKQLKGLSIPVTQVPMPKRLLPEIDFYKWVTLRDVVSTGVRDLSRSPNCGSKTIKELEELLAEYDLELGMELE